jgi:H/ACA ribonucleoprotein complex non-core subunit NAF1
MNTTMKMDSQSVYVLLAISDLINLSRSIQANNSLELDSDSDSDSDESSAATGAAALLAKVHMPLKDADFEDGDDDDEPKPTTYTQTKNEVLEANIMVPEVEQVGAEETLEKVGEVMSIIGNTVIVKGEASSIMGRGAERALDSDTLLVFDDRKVFGYV